MMKFASCKPSKPLSSVVFQSKCVQVILIFLLAMCTWSVNVMTAPVEEENDPIFPWAPGNRPALLTHEGDCSIVSHNLLLMY